ncbi:threonine/serine exporter family protein [Lactobacillus sp. DCY120]|uniref:Threonine/serine exporter family protein n=2 Tax=Bombilactobacillus apium TaxID=2675299 RepID=A0A850RAW3_9LACO|nr:threonine/serine exporter family protein [Bombilactobacillus apium]
MTIHWQDFVSSQTQPILQTSLKQRAAIVGRVGIIMLGCGTGAWRVRAAMNKVARVLGITCSADIGLITLEYTCFDQEHSYSQVLTLPGSGVDTDKLMQMENFVADFPKIAPQKTAQELHHQLDQIKAGDSNYTAFQAGLAAALACSAFVFLLGGGWIEMICCFVGAGLGNWVRRQLGSRHLTLLAGVSLSVAVACLAYLGCFKLLEMSFGVDMQHEAGYIGAMLFVIPGFPFITSMLDMAKQDMRSGLERLMYALMIIVTATLVGFMMALISHLRPENFLPLQLSPWVLMCLRVPASFCGVYGFSVMFNSPNKMAIYAGLIGSVANTLRLELVDSHLVSAGIAAFVGALVAGLLASAINGSKGYPRISLTVPAIVIMIPGLYIYRGMYNLGVNNIGTGALWLSRASLIIMFLPLGLFVARVLLDKRWRHCN